MLGWDWDVEIWLTQEPHTKENKTQMRLKKR